ncbi:OLC1v1019525C1 [Oldenlandia corymbosa var. corymbosa]|uniref:OLC1v1019525C1 n=1 Tax=Oldenlandia corymbosa var. corymbosa TaxID=529605 RepID=A0AAV1EEB2_OLDCO|nr:OLC1v1019525C1 [Oldenlandia corymbosa var. corymbosa]
MASPFHLPVTAAQVGTYFVGQYYQVLQQQPEFVHQFYSMSSTMLRIDGNTRETATGMGQIHALISSLSYTAIEIKTAHSLESWNGGVMVMVSGSVLAKDFSDRRKFVQTFFLAPQDKGYFVLNDIFHFVDEENIIQHPAAYLTHGLLESKINASNALQEQVPNYVLDGDIQGREYAATSTVGENGPVDNYSYAEERLQTVPEADKILEDNYAVQSNGSHQHAVNPVQDHLSLPVEEPVGEPQKLTYASILAKGQINQTVAPVPVNKASSPSSEWQQVPEAPSQPSIPSSNNFERVEQFEETSAFEDEVEVKSVYVRNVPTTMAPSEIEEEFKKFGKLKRDGVAIRTRKDIDICYAFVEYEDITGVRNAIEVEDRTEASLSEEEEEVEAEVAIRWMEEGVALVVVVLADQTVKTAVNESTIDQGQMASTDKDLDKRE